MALMHIRRFLSSTLHISSAGGINGRLAKLIGDGAYEQAIAFYEKSATSTPTSPSTLNYLIEAYFKCDRHLDALKLARQLDNTLQITPNRQTFVSLMRGLVEVDASGSLSLSVDELFQLMRRRYAIEADWETWLLRIQAFLHPKYSSEQTESTPAHIFYAQMLKELGDSGHLTTMKTELLITAINRRLWPFAEFMLRELSEGPSDFSIWQRISLAKGLFSDLASLPIVRELQRNARNTSLALHQCFLNYAARQGRCAADVATKSLDTLLSIDSLNSQRYKRVAKRCLERTLPLDLETFDSSGQQVDRLLVLMERLRCPSFHLEQLSNKLL